MFESKVETEVGEDDAVTRVKIGPLLPELVTNRNEIVLNRKHSVIRGFWGVQMAHWTRRMKRRTGL